MASARSDVVAYLSADSKAMDKAFDNVGKSAKDMGTKLGDSEGKAKLFGGAMDVAAGAADASESKFMGAADLLDGLGGAFGLPTEGATGLMRSFGDLSGGFSALGPMIGGMGSSLMGLATGPVGLIILGIAAFAAGLIALYQNSETFRDIVNAAFDAVKKVIGPIIDTIGKAIGWVVDLFKKNKEETEDATDHTKRELEEINAALEAQQQRWQAWKDKVTDMINGILSPLQNAREQSKVGFEEINRNLVDNAKFFEGWMSNLQRLTDRGFGALSAKMFELGPTAEKAVGEMVSKSDAELKTMTARFDLAGRETQKAFMGPFLSNEALKSLGDQGVVWGTQFKQGFDMGMGGPITVPMNRAGPAVPHLAEGGIVRSPTLALIGESGPEAVVPLGRGAAGGTQVIQLVVDGRVLAEVVRDELLRKQRSTPLGLAT